MSIPNGPSALAVKEAAWGLARYAAISQVSWHVYIYRKQKHTNLKEFLLEFKFCAG